MRMRPSKSACILSTVLLCTFAFSYEAANPSNTSAALREVEKSKAKAEHASINDKCYESVEVVRRLVELAKEQFDAGDLGPAQETVKEMVQYADQAKEASQHSGHKLKQAEIVLRKAHRRLDDLRQKLPYQEQAPLEGALKQLEADDQEILNQVLRH